MQVRKGYLILENIISITITGVIVTTLCAILFSALNLYSKTCSTIEIQQQGLELQNHIERELNENIEIKSIKMANGKNITNEDFDERDIISIKYKPIDRDDSQGLDEIYLNSTTNKVFIKRRNAASGYEVGNYLDKLYIEKIKNGKIINIRLQLSKNNQKYEVKFSI